MVTTSDTRPRDALLKDAVVAKTEARELIEDAKMCLGDALGLLDEIAEEHGDELPEEAALRELCEYLVSRHRLDKTGGYELPGGRKVK